MDKLKNTAIIIMMVICSIIIIITSSILLKDLFNKINLNKSMDELVEEITIENSEDKVFCIDWNRLKEINPDIIAWIKIENTNINYPILETDNLYYLKHSYDRTYNSNGAIFTLNNNPFNDSETIIFGHNMKNNIMFSELGNYLNEDFLYSHLNFEIYTPKYNYKATVFSCYSIDLNQEENNIKDLSLNDKIEYYKKQSKYKIDNVGKIEKVIKLSTCSYLNNRNHPTEKRYYIVAKIEEI